MKFKTFGSISEYTRNKKYMEPVIPKQVEGAQTNTTHTITASGLKEAKDLYQKAKQRLLDINGWQKVCGAASAEFELVDEKGNIDDGSAKENEYFKIDIPGMGNSAGDGYDWVKVEMVEEINNSVMDKESILIKVRPAASPENDNKDIAHFLSDEATSTFIVSRDNLTVTAAVYGRNEMPNTQSEKIVDKIRNTLVGSAAIAGVSKIQWKLLVKGLLEPDKH